LANSCVLENFVQRMSSTLRFRISTEARRNNHSSHHFRTKITASYLSYVAFATFATPHRIYLTRILILGRSYDERRSHDGCQMHRNAIQGSPVVMRTSCGLATGVAPIFWQRTRHGWLVQVLNSCKCRSLRLSLKHFMRPLIIAIPKSVHESAELYLHYSIWT
jgi:hypothetical protein